MFEQYTSKIMESAEYWSQYATSKAIEVVPEPWLQMAQSYLPDGTDMRLVLAAALPLFAVLLFMAIKLLFRGRRSDVARNLADLTNAPRRLALASFAVLVLGIGTWSFLAPLEGAAVAPGVISPDGNRRTVQHLEGGMIRKILAREGDKVTKGQVLLVLDDVEARARFDEIGKRYVHLLARNARLESELADAEAIVRPQSKRWIDDAELDLALSNQKLLLDRRRATQNGQDEILRSRIQQLEEEITGLRRMNEGLGEKLRLIDEENATVSQLVEKGLERKARLFAIERIKADVEIERASNDSMIARNRQKIGETEVQLLTIHQQSVEEVSEEMAEVRRALAEMESELSWRADVLGRTEVRSPISGTVMNVQVTTTAGVIRGGEPILDIVPDGVPLIIDAHVQPIDIDIIHEGMPARVLLSAYQQRNMPQIYGSLRSISADRMIDERTGRSYFLAKVEVPREQLDALPAVDLVPGMPADVMLLTGEKTVADYVFGPLLASTRVSFRENHGH